MKPIQPQLNQRFMMAILAALLLIRVPLQAAQEGEKEGAPDAEAIMKDLERRMHLLEQALVEKDVRIGELNRKLDSLAKALEDRTQQPQTQPPQPGLQFQLSPDQMQEFQKRLNRYFNRNLDDLFEPEDGENDDHNWMFRKPTRPDNPTDPFQQPPMGPGFGQKPRLGVLLSESNAELRQQYRNNVREGAFITRVTPHSAADDAGLMAGDCVVRFMNQPIRTTQDLVELVKSAPAGKHALVVMREGQEKSLQVTLGEDTGNRQSLDDHINRPQREDKWLPPHPGRANRQEHFVSEVNSSMLAFSEELAMKMELNEKQRQKMQAVLTEQQQALNKAFAERSQRPGRSFSLDTQPGLKPLVEEHVKAAEKALEDTLTEKQFRIWREHRENNQTLSIKQRQTSKTPVAPHEEVKRENRPEAEEF